MFGYVRVAKAELKIKEYDLYKAVYCSLCKRLGKSYGILSRLTLSYDFTFLSLLNMSLKDTCVTFERKRCAFNPLKKCNYCKQNEDLNMPSAAAMIMLFYKIKDNISDDKGFKKLCYCLLKPMFSGPHKKAAKKYPQIEEIVSEYIEAQNNLENQNCSSIDEAADPTAKAMSELLMLCSEDEIQKRILDRLGYCLGRFIYLLDAACDYKDDLKHNKYNVFALNTNDYSSFLDDRIKPQLYFCINEATKAFELLDIKKYKSILGNIIYLGLEETMEKELEK